MTRAISHSPTSASPLEHPERIASRIREAILAETGEAVTVLIVDGDTTYSWRNLHIAPRRLDYPGIIHFGGVMSFIIGRVARVQGTSNTHHGIRGDD